jgi:hypothetical protein
MTSISGEADDAAVVVAAAGWQQYMEFLLAVIVVG